MVTNTPALTPQPPSPAEADLMLLHEFTQTGDSALFAEIVQRYARVVYSASIRILNDEGRAQDVSQETFFRLMQRPKLVTHSLAGWLHRTATHLALDVRRSEKARRMRETLYGIEHQESKSARPGWAEVSPYVDQALNEIKEPARGLLIKHFLQGVAQSELAAELDVSAATLSRRIKAGLEELQQNLRKRGIHLGLSTLGFFCTANTGSAVPTAFFAELGENETGGFDPQPASIGSAAAFELSDQAHRESVCSRKIRLDAGQHCHAGRAVRGDHCRKLVADPALRLCAGADAGRALQVK